MSSYEDDIRRESEALDKYDLLPIIRHIDGKEISDVFHEIEDFTGHEIVEFDRYDLITYLENRYKEYGLRFIEDESQYAHCPCFSEQESSSGQQEKVPELIDRASVLAKIGEYLEEYDNTDENGLHTLKWCAMKEAELVIKEEPEAALPAGNWIRCEDKLPEEKISPYTYDYLEYPCLFRISDDELEVRFYKFGKGHWWLGAANIDRHIIAWQERPEI